MKNVTKTITAHNVTALVYNLAKAELENKNNVFTGNPTEKQVENFFNVDGYKFIKVISDEKIDELRKMSEKTFKENATLVEDGKRQGLVTRTFKDYETVVLVYDFETNTLAERTEHGKIDMTKYRPENAKGIKIISEQSTENLYGMPYSKFIENSEPVEKE